MSSFIDDVYQSQNRQVYSHGVKMNDGDHFNEFLSENVASRLYDETEQKELEILLRSTNSTDFIRENLIVSLTTENKKIKTIWEVGEAIAEAYLTMECTIVWPWNVNRDKRVEQASLAGADLVGFQVEEERVTFVFGEVKTSSDQSIPPRVVYGTDGLTQQLIKLVVDPSKIHQLIRWLFSRCKTNSLKEYYLSALKLFNDCTDKAYLLYGILVRDTEYDDRDLKVTSQKLGEVIDAPTICHLCAIYIPCTVSDLPHRVIIKGNDQ